MGTPSSVEDRLDWAPDSSSWLIRFLLAKMYNLVTIVSYHTPILMDFQVSTFVRKHTKFRFENIWLQEQDLEKIVMNA